MASPFPGMDPYLEDPIFWSDFHHTFITYLREAIADVLPEHYDAAVGEKVRLEQKYPRQRRKYYSDVGVVRRTPSSKQPGAKKSVATLEPVSVPLLVLEEVVEAYLEIRHLPGRELVTVIEVLSPANKVNPDRMDYLTKRNTLLKQPIHLVELDLLIGGQRLPTEEPLPSGDYYAIVARSERRPNGNVIADFMGEVYAWTVRERLPTIPIPLLAPDPDVFVNLQAVLTTAYERGRFAKRLNYGRLPKARLAKGDVTWATKIGKSLKR